ncbi:UDP-N-acetylmuramyl-tripeptide synthetase [Patescibacteria group bacterium]|nr:UDP-N-acetylmuramyl-tripeptide synthetase [Patescibacteria group bacterium]
MLKELVKKLIPTPLLERYHYALAVLGTLVYRNPSHKLMVIAVTGTKGKSTVVELIRAIFTEAGYTVAVANTIRFAIGGESEPNLFKMTMPGRFYLQKFLHKAVAAGATHAVIEMTSEGARQHRHVGIELDALVFLNLQREHIESHGSMEQYAEAKLSLARHLETSSKRPRFIIANADDPSAKRFLEAEVEVRAPFSLKDAEPYAVDERNVRFVWRPTASSGAPPTAVGGELFAVPLPGLFNLYNMLAAITLASELGIPVAVIKKALEHIGPIPGRAERVEKGQKFAVVVDYAHTPDSLHALYETYKESRIIAVLGSTGGGRDTWKRPEMGTLADEYAAVAILTNEDPYDEDPQKIVQEIAKGFSKKKPHIILNRRAAVREALREAHAGDAVLITGKGTDPYIMGPRGAKEPWSDKKVVEEELAKLGYH